MLVGAHRAGEFDRAALAAPPDAVRRLELGPLPASDLEDLLAAWCGRTAGLGDVAAEFRHRTGGNPLQVRQLLRRAQREGALRYSADDGRPDWDLRALTAIEITTDVAELLGQAIDQLHPPDDAVLGALACLDHEFDLADAVATVNGPPRRSPGCCGPPSTSG